MTHQRAFPIWWCAVVWLASAAYVISFVDRGWIPHDEGLIGQTAERVLAGELPHRDFDDVYTGGLSYMHALAFKIGGVSSLSLRWTLYTFFLVWVPVVFWIASRSARGPTAALVTAVAVAWSVPNYFASMPSWYNLFFATFGVAALLRHADTGNARWLFAAGMAGGFSFLAKASGLFYIAGGLLFLVINETSDRRDAADIRFDAFVAMKTGLALLLVSATAWLVRTQSGVVPILHFIVPIAAVAALLVWTEIAPGPHRMPARLSRLSRLVIPFLLGAALPIAIFLVPYARSHALGDFYRGVFVLPQRRLTVASQPLGSWIALLPVVPYTALLLSASMAKRIRLRVVITIVGWMAYLLAVSGGPPGYQVLWNLGRHLNIAAVLGGTAVLLRSPRSDDRTELLLLVCVTAFCTLIEFPAGHPIYFCYTAPLVALTLGAVVRSQPWAPKSLHLTVAAALGIFAVARMNTGYVYTLGTGYRRYAGVTSGLAKAPLRVNEIQRDEYARLIDTISRHANGRYIYATPDCPEVYFFSGFANPTRTIYEAFDQSPMTSENVFRLTEARGITVVVINHKPEFSKPLDGDIERALADRFPQSALIGHFRVMWST
jgi:hypothetical protein